jgi:hypothetical protein
MNMQGASPSIASATLSTTMIFDFIETTQVEDTAIDSD